VRGAARSIRFGGAALGVVALVTLGGCGDQSRVDPNAAVVVTGLVTDPGGAPAADRPVRLGTGVTVGDGAFAVLTAGLSCTTGACTGNVRDASTDATGRYTFTLKGADTQSTFGEAESVLVSASGSPTADQVSGPMASARFQVQTEQVEPPRLELVDPALSIEATNGVTARWASPRPGPFELTFEDGEQVPVWLSRTAESTVSVDPRLLEDTAGRVVVGGGSEDAIEGSKVEMRWRSPGVPYAGGAGAPPSRGRPCRYVDAADSVADGPRACGVTDGDLTSAVAVPPVCAAANDTQCEAATAVVIDLDPSVPAELVVVRGCEGACAVEVSADGTTFRSAGAASDAYGVVPLDGQALRAVRVGLGTGFGLREVSVWGPAPPSALRPLTKGQQADLAAPYGGSRHKRTLPWPLVGVAVAVAASVMIGVGIAIGRRRAAPAR